MALIVLVVLGHSWTLLPSEDRLHSWTYDFLYSWHVPAFVIVTGYLSKSFEYTRPRLWSLITTVALPYVIFEGLYAWFRHEVGGVEFERLWANPHWPMWYLAALFFWRLATPVLKRTPGKVVVAVVISLLAGIYANDILDSARILGLLPFFVLGLKMHEGHWNLLRARRSRWYGFAVLLGLFALTRFSGDWFVTEWFYYRTVYDELDPDVLRAITIRMGLLITGVVGAFAFFAVVPRTKTLVLHPGQRHPRGLPVPRVLRARRRVRRLPGVGHRPHATRLGCDHGRRPGDCWCSSRGNQSRGA